MKSKLWVSTVVIILIVSFIPIIIEIVPTVASTLIEVDDSGGKDHLTIQAGVDAAQPGDTVFVYAGVYYEDVYINKTINLTGISRDNTTINSTNLMGIYVENADYVNISGFTVVNGSWAGIRLMPSNNSLVENVRAENNMYGIEIIRSNNTNVRNNIASNNSDYHGIYLDESTNITVQNNICFNNNANGIFVYDSSLNNIIIANNCSNNSFGISIGAFSENNLIKGNNVTFNNNYGLGVFSNYNTFEKNIIISNNIGVRTNGLVGDTNKLINTTIISSVTNDISRGFADNLILLNTTFNKSSVSYQWTSSISYVQWFLHINVIDYLGNPIPNTNVIIEDNINGTYNQLLTTDLNGQIKWLTITEYIEQDTDGNTIGEKTFYSPHKIIAWNDTLVGYAQPVMNESKTVTIVLYNGTLLDMDLGWNLVSIPRIQSDTNLSNVLQSIEGHYDAVQWYNVTDTNDPWKHHHISKPPNLNDFDGINHTIGFWLHIIDSEGTTLVVVGDELTFNQDISLYPGWNLVGYPSKTNKTRDVALGTLNFGSDIDSIWTFNSTSQNWVVLNNSSDYFKIGKGYWMHSKVTEIWNVPL